MNYIDIKNREFQAYYFSFDKNDIADDIKRCLMVFDDREYPDVWSGPWWNIYRSEEERRQRVYVDSMTLIDDELKIFANTTGFNSSHASMYACVNKDILSKFRKDEINRRFNYHKSICDTIKG